MKKKTGWLLLFLFTGLIANAQSAFEKKISRSIKELSCIDPSAEEPVTLNADVAVEGDSVAVIVKVRLAPGWHIYQYVPSNLPYIIAEQILKLPKGMQAVGEWKTSDAAPYANDPGVLIYESDAWFVHKMVRKSQSGEIIQAGLYYQACDLNQCLPPVEKIVEIKIPLKN